MVVHHSYDDILALVPSLKGLLAVTISVGYRMDLLFILSGFLISYAYISPRQGLTLQAYGRILRARLSRIYPSYLVIYILTVIGAILCKRLGIGSLGDYPFKAIPVRLAMLQCWPFFTWAMRHWTGPLWFISAIVFAYLFAFPCAWQLVRKPRSPWTLLFWAFAPPARPQRALVARYRLAAQPRRPVHQQHGFGVIGDLLQVDQHRMIDRIKVLAGRLAQGLTAGKNGQGQGRRERQCHQHA